MRIIGSKLLFFDIDGTLVDFNRKMPDSAMAALRKVQRHGHKVMLCTGRSISQIYPYLLDFGFDGIVGAAGAYVEYEGKVIYHKTYGKEMIRQLLTIFEASDISYMLQQKDGCYLSMKSLHYFKDTLLQSKQVQSLPEVLAAMQKSLGNVVIDNHIPRHPSAYAGTENVLYVNSPLSVEELQKQVGPTLTVTPPSFGIPKPDQGEITMAGVTKAYGIQQIIDYTGALREDTIAFGDAANDLNMILFAGLGVAMGNATPEIKEAADFVTADISDDGIAKAIDTLNL